MNKRMIEDLLDELKIPIGNLGYKYLITAIEIYLKNDLISNEELYLEISEKYKTTPQCVERNIRHIHEYRKEEFRSFFNVTYKLNNRNLLALIHRELERRTNKEKSFIYKNTKTKEEVEDFMAEDYALTQLGLKENGELKMVPRGKNGEMTLEQLENIQETTEWFFSGNWIKEYVKEEE